MVIARTTAEGPCAYWPQRPPGALVTLRHSECAAAFTIRLRAFGVLVLALCVAGCSLISLKTPERPLSSRDLNARILTREFSYHFIAAVAQCADDITARETDPEVLTNALRWKISAATDSQRAATRIVPTMALLDTWALATQMRTFLSQGHPGSTLFGSQQATAVTVANELDEAAQQLARRLIAPDEFARYQRFVEQYTREHPLMNLEFVRPSVVELWSQGQGTDFRLVDSMGTIPEAMADSSDRLRISSDALALQTVWRTQLALRESGYSGSEIRAALKQLDDRLAKVSAAAENSPHLVQDAVTEVRRSVLDVLNRLDSNSASMIKGLRTEREALAEEVRTEREAIVVAAEAQRKAIAGDLARIADQVVRSSGEQARYLAREVLLLLIILAVVVLGLPFAAGYVVGRARKNMLAPPGRNPRGGT